MKTSKNNTSSITSVSQSFTWPSMFIAHLISAGIRGRYDTLQQGCKHSSQQTNKVATMKHRQHEFETAYGWLFGASMVNENMNTYHIRRVIDCESCIKHRTAFLHDVTRCCLFWGHPSQSTVKSDRMLVDNACYMAESLYKWMVSQSASKCIELTQVRKHSNNELPHHNALERNQLRLC